MVVCRGHVREWFISPDCGARQTGMKVRFVVSCTDYVERTDGYMHADYSQRRVFCIVQRCISQSYPPSSHSTNYTLPSSPHIGMASPLVGIAGVNSLLFASYGASKRIISPFPNLSLKEIAAAGAMAGAANAILASPGASLHLFSHDFLGRADDVWSHMSLG